MFDIRTCPEVSDRPKPHRWHDVAQALSKLLRPRPTMPPHPDDLTASWTDVSEAGRLPPVSCAFSGCAWTGGGTVTECARRDDSEHPWDQELREHVLKEHNNHFLELDTNGFEDDEIQARRWDLYKEAVAVVERNGIPVVGPSVDRRANEHLVQVYNNKTIRSLICFCCAQVKPDTGRIRSAIEFYSAKWLLR